MKRFGLVLLALTLGLAPVRGQSADEKKATIAYLQGLQTNTGGFLAGKDAPPKASLRATSSAVRALKYLGGEAKEPKAAAKFVEACFDKASGGFADFPGGKPDVTTTAIGAMAVVELKLPREPYAEGVVKYLDEHAKSFEDIRIAAAGLEALDKKVPKTGAWLEEVAKLHNADGTYGKGEAVPRVTGGAAVVVLRLGGKLEHPEKVLKALKAGQHADGGFGKGEGGGSDLETTYRVLRAFVMLKDHPDAAKLRGFIAKCRNADGGYGVAPGEKSTTNATYFATIVLHWLDAK